MTEIRYDVTDGVALITLDAPERRNALSVEMSRELIDAARTAESDDAVGAVVVTGGAHFCAGAVRSVLADTGRDPVEDEAYRNLETVYAAFTTIGSIGVPTVAAVRGAAVGAGLEPGPGHRPADRVAHGPSAARFRPDRHPSRRWALHPDRPRRRA